MAGCTRGLYSTNTIWCYVRAQGLHRRSCWMPLNKSANVTDTSPRCTSPLIEFWTSRPCLPPRSEGRFFALLYQARAQQRHYQAEQGKWPAIEAGTLPGAASHCQCLACDSRFGQLTVVRVVYRGLASGVLPAAFWTADSHGVRGGVEAAFVSTTTDRSVAAAYASGGSGGLVLELQQGMCNRGAELAWLSQYPHEREILFAPLTGIEMRSTRIEGRTIVAEMLLSVNLTAPTIEQVSYHPGPSVQLHPKRSLPRTLVRSAVSGRFQDALLSHTAPRTPLTADASRLCAGAGPL